MPDPVWLHGTIRTVIYQNEENGYAVLKLETDDGQTVTAVGTIPLPAPGEEITLSGSWTEHAAYGSQFKGELLERLLPTTAAGILAYLAGGAVPGIGGKTAEKLVQIFGDKTLQVLERQPELLQSQAGMSLKRARAAADSFRSRICARQLIEFMRSNGFNSYLALRVYRIYADDALEQVQQNPYLLTDESIGADFTKADSLAIRLGIPLDDPRRVDAGVLYELAFNMNLGHVFLRSDKLIQATSDMLHLSGIDVEKALQRLNEDGSIITESIEGIRVCYIRRMYEAESRTAYELLRLAAIPQQPTDDFQSTLLQIENTTAIRFAPEQRQAIRLAAQGHVLVLTGGPGTGKTTTVRGILALYDSMGLKTLLAAPTGRAAKRIEELCGREAATIHRMLEVRLDENSGQMSFFHDEDCPLQADAVIVDEVSMLDISLMSSLMLALPDTCRLVLVGDRDQLPSVGPGRVLSGIMRSGVIPCIKLKEIFRQAQSSLIVTNAHAVNSGQMPVLNATDRDFFFLRRRSAEDVVQTICDLCSRRLPQNMGIPAEQIQVLSPSRIGRTGTINLNRQLQAALNPAQAEKPELTFGDYVFRRGDRVMQIRNNYDIIWTKNDGEQGCGIYNGDVGKIEDINLSEKFLTVLFDDRVVEYSFEMLTDLEPAFAVTVHKSQGSEYRAVILSVYQGPQPLLTRSVLYTAITRARELLILVGDEGVVEQMVANTSQTKRCSALCRRLLGGVRS